MTAAPVPRSSSGTALPPGVRPMSTAPMDGREVLGYWSGGKTWAIVYCSDLNERWCDEGGELISPPTHWHPLPDDSSGDPAQASPIRGAMPGWDTARTDAVECNPFANEPPASPPAALPAGEDIRKALRGLCIELEGIWDAFEYGLRHEISNTNYVLVRDKIQEARRTLAIPSTPSKTGAD